MMTYLGNSPGAGSFVFMRPPNNVLFYATHCIFNESMFPKCNTKTQKMPVTRLQENAPSAHHHSDTIPVDEEDVPQRRSTIKGKERANPPIREGEHKNPRVPEQQAPPLLRRESPPPPPAGLRRSQRTKKPVYKPDNSYGQHSAMDILNDPSGKKGQRKIQGPLPTAVENRPGPSS
jgi:hypothetical protein